MKKISTTTAKAFSKMQKLTIGLDLGDRSSWYCVLDERGELVLEQQLSTTPKAMEEVFGRMPGSRIALETGTHSPFAQACAFCSPEIGVKTRYRDLTPTDGRHTQYTVVVESIPDQEGSLR